MEVLPIKSIRDEDVPLTGGNLLSLAKLYQAEIGSCEGIIVFPPHFKLKTVLEHFQYEHKEVFEQSLHIIKSEIKKIAIPWELEKALVIKKIDANKLWTNLLDGWVEEIRARIWREGFYQGLTENLTTQPIFFTKKILVSGEAYFDFALKHSAIKLTQGSLTPEQIFMLDEIVKKANKKLFLPHTYHFIYDGKIRIVKVAPFTQYPKKEDDLIFSKRLGQPLLEDIKKTSIKVFIDLSENYEQVLSLGNEGNLLSLRNEQVLSLGNKIMKFVDGVIIHAEKILDHEMKLAKFAEIASEYAPNPVIYKLADIKQNDGDVRGALRLTHQETLLKKEVEAFLFAKNKKQLINAQIAIPYIRNVNEFLQLKRDLASLGISRKGNLKMWLEFAVPENIINLEQYLVAGFDGAIINLDELSSLLGGFDPKKPEGVYYAKQVNPLLKFLEDGLKLLHKSNIPVIFLGSLSLHDEVLKFLVAKGVWGVVVDLINVSHIHDQLHFFEAHHIKQRQVN